MGFVARGVVLGLAFGLGAAILDTALAGLGTVQRGFGPGWVALGRMGAYEMALGALLGLAVSPLLRARGGRLLAVAALALAWLALGWWVEFEAPLGRLFVLVPPAGAALLVLLGSGLARLGGWLPWTAGAALFAAAAFVPAAWVDARTPDLVPRSELPPAPEGAPDVVVIVIDTVRAANVSPYGYTRETAPTLASLAREGALFSDATSPSTWSLPSHASLFTGRYPSSHGAHGENLYLADTYPTLAQVLAARGYETTCFTSNAWISDGLGLTRGFAWQDGSWKVTAGAGRNFSFVFRLLDRVGLLEGDKGGAMVAGHFAEWLRARPVDARPTFVFLNFIEAHFPYHQLPREYRERYTDRPRRELAELSMALMAQQFGGPGRDVREAGPPARDMYDGGILYTDELVRRVVEAIRARGTLDRTVLVVLADHGEVLGERAGFFGHGPGLYQESVHVPLLVRYPPRIAGGVRVEAPVSTVGVFATVLDLADVEPPPTLQVGSLVPLVAAAAAGAAVEADAGGPVLAEVMRMSELGSAPDFGDRLMDPHARFRAYRSGPWKLVESSGGDTLLFHLGEDPEESRDLARERPQDVTRLRAELEAATRRIAMPPLDATLAAGAGSEALDEATRERLKQLGYIE
jgi:arylsulfatase A-like enzyme